MVRGHNSALMDSRVSHLCVFLCQSDVWISAGKDLCQPLYPKGTAPAAATNVAHSQLIYSHTAELYVSRVILADKGLQLFNFVLGA